MAGYKINIQKSVAFLYAYNEILEKEYKNTTLKTAPPKNQILGINLTKEAKDLYAENYKTSIKEIKEDAKKWKDIPGSWIRRLISSKWPYHPKQSIDSMPSLSFFTEIE